jgi:glutaredoxin 3
MRKLFAPCTQRGFLPCSAFFMTSSSRPLLYIKPGCPWCHEVTSYLGERGIGYHEVNVMEDAAAFTEMQRKSGQSRVPTLDWNGKILADFGVIELVPFLRKLDTAGGKN